MANISPKWIKSLGENEIFVFGSNLAGFHGGGAAALAMEWGAVWGQGTGLQGKTYAIPTMFESAAEMKPCIDEFLAFAKARPELTFLVTELGCGIAGFTPKEVAPFFKAVFDENISNVWLPERFVSVLTPAPASKSVLTLVLALIALAVPVGPSAQSTATPAKEPPAMTALRKNYGGNNAVTATFDLSIYWNVREKEEKKSGELLIAPGNKFKVTLGKEAFVSDGKTFWQYSEKNSQVVIRNFSDIDESTVPSKFLLSFLSNRVFAEKQRNGSTLELFWDGKGKSAGIDGDYTSITAVVDEKNGSIKTLKLTDKNENIHTYTFKKTVFDKPPKDDVFRFKPPKGVEALDMRGGVDSK
jgi:outer membrane lipoprotein-sorting protein